MVDRLLKFVILINVGSYTKAAQTANISQPALSMAMQQLERELGQQLLLRTTGAISMTPAGQAAYNAGVAIQGSLRTLQLSLSSEDTTASHYNVGMTDSVASLLFSDAQLLLELQQLGTLNVTVDATAALVTQLARGTIDLAIGTQTTKYDTPVISKQYLYSEELVLICNAHQFDKRQTELQQGSMRDFIAYNESSNTYRLLHEYLQEHGIHTEILTYSTSPDVMLKMVQNGLGIALLPKQKIDELTDNSVRILPGLSVPRPMYLYESKLIAVPSVSSILSLAVKAAAWAV